MNNQRCVEYIPEATEPSLFTRGEGVIHPHWLKWFATKYALSHSMAFNIGTALCAHLLREKPRYIDPDSVPPPVVLDGSELVSMAFVVDYKHRHNVTYAQAYTAGLTEIFKERGCFPDQFSPYAVTAAL